MKFLSKIVLFFMVVNVQAAGGLSAGTSVINDIVDYAYGAVGVLGGGYLLFKAVQAWNGREDWMDFLKACGWVAIAGGSIPASKFLWGVFA